MGFMPTKSGSTPQPASMTPPTSGSSPQQPQQNPFGPAMAMNPLGSIISMLMQQSGQGRTTYAVPNPGGSDVGSPTPPGWVGSAPPTPQTPILGRQSPWGQGVSGTAAFNNRPVMWPLG